MIPKRRCPLCNRILYLNRIINMFEHTPEQKKEKYCNYKWKR